MRRHPLDPIALVAGAVSIVAGVVAALHQGGAISLGLPAVVLMSLVVLGLAGAGLVLLSSRRPADLATSAVLHREVATEDPGSDEVTEPGTDETAG